MSSCMRMGNPRIWMSFSSIMLSRPDLDPRREVGKLVDGEDAAVGPGDDPEVDDFLVGIGQLARGGLDRVDVADEVRDGDVRGGQLLAVAGVARHPLDGSGVPALAATVSLPFLLTGARGSSFVSVPAMTGTCSSRNRTRPRRIRVLACPRSPRRMKSCLERMALTRPGMTVDS